MYKFKKYEDIPSEEIDDIELVGDDFAPGAYISFTPTFKDLGTVVSWDLRECNDVQARNQGGEQALRVGQGHLLVQLQSSIWTTNALLRTRQGQRRAKTKLLLEELGISCSLSSRKVGLQCTYELARHMTCAAQRSVSVLRSIYHLVSSLLRLVLVPVVHLRSDRREDVTWKENRCRCVRRRSGSRHSYM